MSADMPMLLLMKGHPGSGNSSLAQEFLAKRLGLALVDKDHVRDCLAALQVAAKRAEQNALSDSIMWRVASTQLECSNSIIVDCHRARRLLYEAGLRVAQRVGRSDGTCELPSSLL